LTVVELHELLIPHDSIVGTGVITVNGWSGCTFIGRRQLTNVGAFMNWPVGGGLSTRSSKVKPWLTIRSRGMVRHSSVGWVHMSTMSVVLMLRRVGVMSLRHTILGWAHVWTSLRSVDFSQCVDVLKLRSSEVSVVSTSSTSIISESTSSATTTTTSTTSLVSTTVTEGRVFTGELGLDSLSVRRVSDGRENRSDALD
jgi:hypothetical protein